MEAVHAARNLQRLAGGTIAAAILAYAGPVRADCALIPTAVRPLASEDGAVDRPFASPGDTVTVFSDGACKSSSDSPHFSPVVAENVVTLVFQPPTGVVPPAVPPIVPTAVEDCGTNRCFALEFQIPDTNGLAGAFPLTGPARIEVRNNAAGGALVAQVETLFERVRGCNKRNRFPSLFKKFIVLPPRNPYVAGAGVELLATVDGRGALLIPLDYQAVLASQLGGTGALRLLTITADLPNGLAAGNGLPGAHDGFIRLPRVGRYVRAFSFEGRPIPPLLEVTASTPLSASGAGGTVEFGDTILGSVDFIDSVLRIAKTGLDPSAPGNSLQIFALDGEQGVPGLALEGGVGPIRLTNASTAAGPVAPLNSLKSSGKLAVIARDETLEAPFGTGNQNTDGDTDDRVVEFIDLSDGNPTSTGMAVMEAVTPQRKALTAAAGSHVAFFQSEAHEGSGTSTRTDFLGDGEATDGILRVWTADASHPLCSGSPCELTTALPTLFPGDTSVVFESADGRGALAFSGSADPSRYVFFADAGSRQFPSDLFRLSLRNAAAEATGDSFDPAISASGNHYVWSSLDPEIAPLQVVTWERATSNIHIDTTTGVTTGSFTFNPGDEDVPGLDYSSLASGVFDLQAAPTIDPLTSQFWGTSQVAGGVDFFSEILMSDPAFSQLSELPVTDTTAVTSQGSFSSVTVGPPLMDPSAFGVGNLFFLGDGNVVDGSIVPDCCGGALEYDVAGTIDLLGEYVPSGQQVFSLDLTSLPIFGLVSKSASGAPGNGTSGLASISGDGTVVAFFSDATNLVPGGTATRDVYVVDNGPGTIVAASAGGNATSTDPDVAADGGFVSYTSSASNLVGGDSNGASDILVYDVAFPGNQRVSVTNGGAQANGASKSSAISADGTLVAFESLASNLVAGDTNGVSDVFVRDRVLGTTRRVSIGVGGQQANGASTEPDMSSDGRYIAFVSAASNLVPPGTVLNAPTQCYVYDRIKGTTELVSITLGGQGANASCRAPSISPSARFVSFASDATNLYAVPGVGRRAYVYDRSSGITVLANRLRPPGLPPTPIALDAVTTPSAGPVGDRTGVTDAGSIVFDTPVADLGPITAPIGPTIDTNGVSDVYVRFNLFPGDAFGTVKAFDTQTGGLIETGFTPVPGTSVSVAGGRAGFVATSFTAAAIYDVEGGGLLRLPNGTNAAQQIVLSESTYCLIDGLGALHLGDPSEAIQFPTPGPGEVPPQATGIVATDVKAVGDRCVFRDEFGILAIALRTGASNSISVVAGEPVEDYVVGETGVAFRTCESAITGDLNGDTDEADCVMRFWEFEPGPGDPNPIDTGRTAELCTFPGCDPFFEPYKVTGGIVTFVSFESRESDEGGGGGVGDSCLPIAPPGVCDLTGDRDGDDAAIEIYSVASGRAQSFPIDLANPPKTSPFPTIVAGTNSVMTIQLPAEVVGGQFDVLPPEQLVTVIVGDADGDGTFDADGNLDPQTTVADLCAEVVNPAQLDADGDLLGKNCDLVLDPVTNEPETDAFGQTIENDDPLTAPQPAQIPGANLCDLNLSGLITRPEVDQVWADRGTPISAPADVDGDGFVDPTDDRDPDVDGEITAVDFRLCLSDCDLQPGGCPLDEAGNGDGGVIVNPSCGLLGIEFLVLLPWLRRLRRRGRMSPTC